MQVVEYLSVQSKPSVHMATLTQPMLQLAPEKTNGVLLKQRWGGGVGGFEPSSASKKPIAFQQTGCLSGPPGTPVSSFRGLGRAWAEWWVAFCSLMQAKGSLRHTAHKAAFNFLSRFYHIKS